MDAPLAIMANPGVGRIIDAFSDCFGIRIALFSAEGNEAVVGRNKSCCGYCQYIRENLGRIRTCLALDEEKRQEALKEKKLLVYTCHAGMTEAVLPVFLNDFPAGYLMIGQFRTVRILPPKVIKTLTGDEEHKKNLRALFAKTPFYDKVKRDSMYELFGTLVDYIMSRNLLEIRQDYTLGRILAQLRDKISSAVSLPELAEHAGVSVSKACQLYKSAYGTTIKKTLLKIKMEEAARLLTDNPGLAVKQTAYSVGFKDPYYFSRAFSKHFGYSPTLYRKNHKRK